MFVTSVDTKCQPIERAKSSCDSKSNAAVVVEIQGLYGPFSLSERVIQKIWQRQDFFRSAKFQTLSGKSLRVIHPGHWNSQEGPGFREAQLEIDGQTLVGDVALHFQSKDWFVHSRECNAHFDNTILHGVLFPLQQDEPLAITSKGRELETFVLLDVLEHDLEEYAHNEAILALKNRNNWDRVERLLDLPLLVKRGVLSFTLVN